MPVQRREHYLTTSASAHLWEVVGGRYVLEVPSSGNFCVGVSTRTVMDLLHIRLLEMQHYMNLVPMASVLGRTPTSRPRVPQFILVVLYNRGKRLLVTPG